MDTLLSFSIAMSVSHRINYDHSTFCIVFIMSIKKNKYFIVCMYFVFNSYLYLVEGMKSKSWMTWRWWNSSTPQRDNQVWYSLSKLVEQLGDTSQPLVQHFHQYSCPFRPCSDIYRYFSECIFSLQFYLHVFDKISSEHYCSQPLDGVSTLFFVVYSCLLNMFYSQYTERNSWITLPVRKGSEMYCSLTQI